MSTLDVDERAAEPGDTPRSGREARRKFWVDLGLFAAWMIAAVPGATGVPLHEWIAVGIIAVLLAHVVMHWTWVVRHLQRLRVRAQNQVNRLVNLAMWTLAIAVMLSGLVISEAALPAVGIEVQQTTLWMRVHSLSSMLLLVVLAVHVLSHLDWILAQVRGLLGRAR